MAEYFGGDPRVHGRAAERGAVTGFMQVKKGKSAGRNAQGQFTSYQQQAKDEHTRDAKTLQELVVAMQKARIKRPKVSTGRLSRVTDDSRNRVVNVDGFYVGIESHLAKSDAKYWRTIEFGSAEVWKRPFVGMPLLGTWGASISGWGENRWGTVPHAGPTYTHAGKASGGKFRPFGKRAAKKMAATGKIPTVGQEIAPMHAYRDAWREFGGTGTLRRRHAQQLRRLLEGS